MQPTPKKRFGGPQEGAGRPRLTPEQKARQHEVSLPPRLYGLLVDSVGTGRGAVSREIVRILDLYFSNAKVI